MSVSGSAGRDKNRRDKNRPVAARRRPLYYLSMHWLVLLALAIVVGVLIYTLVRLGRNDYSLLANHMARKTRNTFELLKPCPLCGFMLRKGETVHSIVYSGDGRTAAAPERAPTTPARRTNQPRDYLAHLFGCPYCYPANAEHPRHCPVCHKTLPPDGYVVARMFDKPGRKHVHVLGCGNCRKRP